MNALKRLPGLNLALIVLVLEAAFIQRHGDVSWVDSTPRSPVPASLCVLALQLKPKMSGASVLHALPFDFNPSDATGTQRVGVCSAKMC